jgi:hypothetical protein
MSPDTLSVPQVRALRWLAADGTAKPIDPKIAQDLHALDVTPYVACWRGGVYATAAGQEMQRRLAEAADQRRSQAALAAALATTQRAQQADRSSRFCGRGTLRAPAAQAGREG